MKKFKGFTYINTIIIISIIIVIVFNIVDNTRSKIFIYEREEDYIQAKYFAESLINILMAEEEILNKEVMYIFDNYGKRESIEKNIDIEIPYFLDYLDSYSISIDKNSKFDEYGFKIRAKVSYKDIEEEIFSYGTLVNDIYKEKSGILNNYTIDKDEIENLKVGYNNLERLWNENNTFINLDNKEYYIRKNGKKNEIYKVENNEKSIVTSFRNQEAIFINQNNSTIIIDENVEITGILNVDNLILLSDCTVNGIVNLRGDIISDKNSLRINGCLVNLFNSSENNISVEYDDFYISLFKKNLPLYIKPKIFNISTKDYK